jgi:hypothetical protein
LYITLNTRKGGIKDRYPRTRGGPFFCKGGQNEGKKEKDGIGRSEVKLFTD